MTYSPENRANLLRQGYTIAVGVKDGEQRIYFLDEKGCSQCRVQAKMIRKNLFWNAAMLRGDKENGD